MFIRLTSLEGKPYEYMHTGSSRIRSMSILIR